MDLQQNETRTLWCIIHGDVTPFKASYKSNTDIHDLKELVHKKGINDNERILAKDLVLWKLKDPIAIKPSPTLAERIRSLGNMFADFADELRELVDQVSGIFPHPPEGCLHIIVQPPAAVLAHRRTPSDPPRLTSDIINRDETVTALYKKVNLYKFIEVRGTPASGKSTLSLLLYEYIKKEEPTTNVIWLDSWTILGDRGKSKQWQSHLRTMGIESNDGTIIILDEAQTSYWDSGLWSTFFKPICDKQINNRVIIFTSRGSATSTSGVGRTPMVIPLHSKVTLRPIDHNDGTASIGLFLTRFEFKILRIALSQLPRFAAFEETFYDWVYHVTGGHVGAVKDLIQFTASQTSYRKLKHGMQRYTADYHYQQTDDEEFLRIIDKHSTIFRRGLPEDLDLQENDIACVLEMVCYHNVVFGSAQTAAALDICLRRGWLHTDLDQTGRVGFIFPSPLHRWFVERKLFGFGTTTPKQASLLEFSRDVICRFSPINLKNKRIVGPGFIQRPPEAQYQDEFHRCCHDLAKGSTVTFPEFGTGTGRVDFYVPSKKWGIQLVREGDRLENHYERFSSSGNYATLDMNDFIVLDFRVTQAVKPRPLLSKLYHVALSVDFRSCEIMTSTGIVVDRFTLIG